MKVGVGGWEGWWWMEYWAGIGLTVKTAFVDGVLLKITGCRVRWHLQQSSYLHRSCAAVLPGRDQHPARAPAPPARISSAQVTVQVQLAFTPLVTTGLGVFNMGWDWAGNKQQQQQSNEQVNKQKRAKHINF